jgi:hypothetical protein
MVMQRIQRINGRSVLQFLTDEELEFLALYESPASEGGAVLVTEPIRGVGNCYGMVEDLFVPPIMYGDEILDIAALIDSAWPVLQAEFDDFNHS